jgi:hypothetical protein
MVNNDCSVYHANFLLVFSVQRLIKRTSLLNYVLFEMVINDLLQPPTLNTQFSRFIKKHKPKDSQCYLYYINSLAVK